MVEHLQPTGRIGAVVTPTRVRSVKRDRHGQGRHDQKPDEEKKEDPPAGRNEKDAESNTSPDAKASSTGQRINVVI